MQIQVCQKSNDFIKIAKKAHFFCARINKIFGGDPFLKEALLKYFALGLAFSRDGSVKKS